MLYSVGDILECKETVNTLELEMSNPEFDIKPGDRFRITDTDDYPESIPSHWYKLTSTKDDKVILNAWNDEGHMIVDDKFIRRDY